MNKVFKIALLGVMFFSGLNVYAQQNHFVYIQSDDKLPFDVTVNGETYNSSSIGYVIIPKLVKGNYQLNVSFPNKRYPDQQFNCSIDKADAGFLLKNYTDKGWGLYNLQTLEIITNGAASQVAVTEEVKPAADTGAFGNMLSEVVDDSTLNIKTEPVKPPEKEKPAIVADTIAALKEENVTAAKDTIAVKSGNALESQPFLTPNVSETINVAADAAKITLRKLSTFTTGAGTDIVFVDRTAGLNDTIRIFLPAVPVETETVNTKTDTIKQPVAENVKTDTATVTLEETPIKKEAPAVDTSGEVKNPFFAKDDQKADVNKEAEKSIVAQPDNTQISKEPTSVIARPDCKAMLSDNEMDKLRKKMVSAGNDEKMIGVARKNMGDKCISTEQVKSLGALFLSDDGRYNFFNAVHGYVYDMAAFSSLENQLIDQDYKKRFRDLLK